MTADDFKEFYGKIVFLVLDAPERPKTMRSFHYIDEAHEQINPAVLSARIIYEHDCLYDRENKLLNIKTYFPARTPVEKIVSLVLTRVILLADPLKPGVKCVPVGILCDSGSQQITIPMEIEEPSK